jgi:hypothetical protein
MTRLPRATLLLALSLLTSTATAHADCAWVLWGEVTGPPAFETLNYLISASDTRQTCEQARDKHVAQVMGPKPPNTEVTLDELSGRPRVISQTKWKDGTVTTTVHRYVCLPDTVDPRGPKGK